MRIHLVINALSGRGQGRVLAHRLRRFDPILLIPARAAEQLGAVVAAGDVVVVAGGDGTASLIVATLFRLGLGEAVALVLFPSGTGNDLAHCLGVATPSDPAGFLDAFDPRKMRTCPVAVWRMGTQYFINYASFGLDAQILATADRWRPLLPVRPVFRKLSLGLAGLRHPFYRVQHAVHVETDLGAHPMQGLGGVIFSNIGYYAGGSRVGELDPAAPRLSMTEIHSSFDLIRLYFSRYGGPQPVLPYTRVASVRVDGDAVPLELDGEVAVFEPAQIVCIGTVRFLVPRRSAETAHPLR